MSLTSQSLRVLHTAELLLTMQDESGGIVRDGGVVVDEEGRVLEVGPFSSLGSGFDLRYNHSVLMPGVVNCHMHLTDALQTEPVGGGHGLNQWVRSLLASRGESGGLNDAIDRTLREMREAGTAAIGEVANTFSTLEAIKRSDLKCRFIYELLGFRKDRADGLIETARDAGKNGWSERVRYAVGVHAPYSVSLELVRLIEELNDDVGAYTYEHLAEDPDERLLYETASGPWRAFLEEVGAWEPTWRGKGESPIEVYRREGLLNERLVAVHLANATASELALLALRGVRAILSPTSNLHITGMLPNLEAIVHTGMTVAFGTDGRGSNPSVDVFDEARVLYERWPDLNPGMFLRGLTVNGGAILGFEDIGSIAPGMQPGLVSIELPRLSATITALEQDILSNAVWRKRVG